MCITCSRNVLHEVNAQLCSRYHFSWEDSGACHYCCCQLTWMELPEFLYKHQHTVMPSKPECRYISSQLFFPLFYQLFQYLRSLFLSVEDAEHCLHTLLWGLNMDFASFVGSEVVSEFTTCTLSRLTFLSYSLSSSCIFYCCLMAIYIKQSSLQCCSNLSALLLCSLHQQNQHVHEQDHGTRQSTARPAVTTHACPASHLATESTLFSIPHSGEL